MKTIPLTQGEKAIVDESDYDWLTLLGSWHFDRYAKRVTRKDGVVYMHRLIMGNTKGHIDHINGNKLDNRRANLRVCTPQQNIHHMASRKGTSQYKGVSWDKRRNKWKAVIGYEYKRIDIGRYDTEQEAALAYNDVAKKLHKEFAVLNQVQ
jgi:hypothetical protein